VDHKPTQAISKSKFVAGAQCLKRLYFQVHQPELAAEPDASGYAIMAMATNNVTAKLRMRSSRSLKCCCTSMEVFQMSMT